MHIIRQFTTPPGVCAYLGDRVSKLEYSLVSSMDPQQYEDLMNRGFRKFGPALFRPICDACQECRPIRLEPARFAPSRSQRRAWAQNQDLRVEVSAPTVDRQRSALHRHYHDAQTARKGWPESHKDESEYAFQFVQNPIPGAEISLWDGPVLKAIVIADLTPNVVSGVYHFYDPDSANRSLGTYCMLQTIELARRLAKRWAYFGFFVSGCESLSYKARFQPCEIMQPDGRWVPYALDEAGPRDAASNAING